jgi:hypothetical protein
MNDENTRSNGAQRADAYAPPVDQLLSYGEAQMSEDWPDYLALGIGKEHISDLIRMATDEALLGRGLGYENAWGPTHAWRALGQLEAEEAIEPLLSLFHFIDDRQDEWMTEELPKVYGMIGPAAIPGLAAYLADTSHGQHARIAAAASLEAIGTQHPEARDACVTTLTRYLEQISAGEVTSDPSLNGFVIRALIQLEAAESAPVIEQVFADDVVDFLITGDWQDVQVDLGLLARRQIPRRWTVIRDPATRQPVGIQKHGGGSHRSQSKPKATSGTKRGKKRSKKKIRRRKS